MEWLIVSKDLDADMTWTGHKDVFFQQTLNKEGSVAFIWEG